MKTANIRPPVPSDQECYRVAVVKWQHDDDIATVIGDELQALGHVPLLFCHTEAIPQNVDVVFSFAPYGNFLHVPRQLARIPSEQRPTFVHWNTEGLPDLRLPWRLVRTIAAGRSWLERRLLRGNDQGHRLNQRMLRFRYVGDYYYAYTKGWLNVFADSSAIYARWHRQHGLPAIFTPWGATPRWYRNLHLERDIDVLWMGSRGSRRRNHLLLQLQRELSRHSVTFHLADNVENSFIFGENRIRFLNRAKITLNLTRTWYDDNFSRFALAAPNRSLIVSEPLLPHCPDYEAGVHYVSAPIEKLSETILYYLAHEEERQRIVENACHLVTTKLTFHNSIKAIMDAVARTRPAVGYDRREDKRWMRQHKRQ